jgi:hypothetical protein
VSELEEDTNGISWSNVCFYAKVKLYGAPDWIKQPEEGSSVLIISPSLALESKEIQFRIERYNSEFSDAPTDETRALTTLYKLKVDTPAPQVKVKAFSQDGILDIVFDQEMVVPNEV